MARQTKFFEKDQKVKAVINGKERDATYAFVYQRSVKTPKTQTRQMVFSGHMVVWEGENHVVKDDDIEAA
ncbi:hypothetical protein R3P38DRAFT_3229751 [Favolaschia claudopus]|uniref:Uncharacterized protein n=1 Tax=Favolaschia claudopus TaxID=2862362 RepID=A0AAV9ZJ85_9AGAR